MNKILIGLVLMFFMAIFSFGADYGYPNVTTRDTHGKVINGDAVSESIYAVSVSSYGTLAVTTPVVIAANANRKSITFDNTGAKTVVYNTYSITDSSSSFTIPTVTKQIDDSGYTGAYYLLTNNGESAQTVIIRDISK